MIRTLQGSALDSVRPLTPQEFEQIRQLAYRTFGLDLKPGKEELVSSRLRKLVCTGGFQRFQDYYRSVLQDHTGEQLRAMIDALATNHTSFLREPDHFRYLCEQVIPSLREREPVEVWCAACSTGEEVWTLSMALNEAAPHRDIRISASDISNKALHFAQHASYPVDRCHALPRAWLGRYFAAQGRPPSAFQVGQPLRSQVTFRRINLLDSYSWPRAFPIVFCRNVMIYFDQATQARVIEGLTRHLEPGGYLFVGHAESLTRVAHSLEFVSPAVYRKPGRGSMWNK
ncbi:MAG: protein-glutamate O-methyltransferase CheR [Candidatus Solibacter sp.]